MQLPPARQGSRQGLLNPSIAVVEPSDCLDLVTSLGGAPADDLEEWSEDHDAEEWSKDRDAEEWSEDHDAEEWSEDHDAEEWSEDHDAEEWSKDHLPAGCPGACDSRKQTSAAHVFLAAGTARPCLRATGLFLFYTHSPRALLQGHARRGSLAMRPRVCDTWRPLRNPRGVPGANPWLQSVNCAQNRCNRRRSLAFSWLRLQVATRTKYHHY